MLFTLLFYAVVIPIPQRVEGWGGGETDLLDWNDSQITKSHSFGL